MTETKDNFTDIEKEDGEKVKGYEEDIKADCKAGCEDNEDICEEVQEENTEAEAEEQSETEEADETEKEADEESGEDGKTKGFFKKKKDKKDEQIEELTDKNKRLMAEFQNFRNRSEKEKTAMYEMGAKSIIEKILPVVDNFERGLAMIPDEDKESSVGKGMDMIYKQLTTTLEDLGVKPIDAKGKEFDPLLHNAVMHVEDEELGENVVAEELQKGYMYRETVVRPSMVKVAN